MRAFVPGPPDLADGARNKYCWMDFSWFIHIAFKIAPVSILHFLLAGSGGGADGSAEGLFIESDGAFDAAADGAAAVASAAAFALAFASADAFALACAPVAFLLA